MTEWMDSAKYEPPMTALDSQYRSGPWIQITLKDSHKDSIEETQ